VNGLPVNNNGDNPSSTANGNIIFQAYETDNYVITFTDTDCYGTIYDGVIPNNLCTNYYGIVEAMVNDGLRCAGLKTELHNLIENHTVIPYTSSGSFDVIDFMCTYDTDASGNVLNRYSNLQSSCNGNSLPGSYNRDHVLPSSWWGGSASLDQYTDLFNLLHKFLCF